MSNSKRKQRTGTALKKLIAKSQPPHLAFNFPGKYFGWQLQNIPADYLEWILEEVHDLKFRDVAEIELIRRKGTT